MTSFGQERVLFARLGVQGNEAEGGLLLDSNPLMQSVSSLNADTSSLLASIVRNSKHESKGRCWNYRKKLLAVFILERSSSCSVFLRSVLSIPTF